MNGAAQIEQMQKAGFSSEEIGAWSSQKRQHLTSAGFGEGEVDAWFGQKEPNLEPFREHVRKNLLAAGATEDAASAAGTMAEFGANQAGQVSAAAVQPEQPQFTRAERDLVERGAPTKIVGTKPARTFDDALSAGLQISVSGLLARGKSPNRVLTEDAPMASRIAANIGTVIGDLPFMAAGAFAGSAGGPVGAGAGAFALPAGFRATLMDAYEKGDFKSAGDFFERASGIIWEEIKGGITGAATVASGGAASVATRAAPMAVRAMAPTAAEVATMVSVGKALDGEMPKAQDFLDAAVMLGGLKVAGKAPELAAKLRGIYAKTGASPQEVLAQAAKDPTVLQDLAAENRDVPEAFEPPPGSPDYKPSLSDPDYRRELALMRDETGWAETGGRMIREPSADGLGEVTGRTSWVPRTEWWQGRPAGLTEAETKNAIDKALAGEKLGAGQQRAVDYMLNWARDTVVEPARQLDEAERAAIANDLATQALDQTPRNTRDVDLIARAVQSDEAAVDAAAIRHADDHAAFMAEVRRINDGAEAGTDARTEAPRGSEGGGQTPRELEADRAAHQARESVRELQDHELEAVEGGAAAPPGSIALRPASSPEPSRSQKAVLDRVSIGEGEKRAYSWDKFYTDMKDELYPIRVLTDALRGNAELATSKDPYKLARLTRGVAGKAQQFLDFSPFKFDTYESVGKSLKAIMEPLQDDLDGLRSYMVARRAIELSKRDIETGVPLEEAKQVVRDGDKYAQAFKEIGEYQDHLVRYLVDAGVISKDGAAAMREANKDYVPFFRLMGDEGGKGGAGPGMSVRSPIKAIKGSERKVIDPLESIIKNTYLYTTLAEHNAVGASLVSLWEAAGKPDVMKKVSAGTKPIEVQEKEVRAFLDAHGIEGDADAFTIFRRNNMNPTDNQVVVFTEGKREVYELPKETAAAFKGLDRESAGLLVKILAIPARTLRAGATLAPDFAVKNFVRDQGSATIFSKNGYIPGFDFVRGLVSVARADEVYQDWLKSGGANATMISMDRQYLQERLAGVTGEEASVAAKAWNVVKAPIELLRIGSELVENATRVGEFKRAIGEGGKEAAQAAAFESREVTLDFARIGAKTRSVNMITAFWNAQVEGVDRMARAIKDDPFGTMVRIGASITMPSLLLWWANHDDPRWKEIPDWERDIFWIVMTKDHVFRVPKPFELGMVFGSIPERILDKFVDDKPDAMKNLGKSIMNVFGFNVIPTAAAPALQHMTNYSFFTDRPLIPSNLEKLLPEYQYTPYTTEATKALGQLVGAVPGMHESSLASPLVIDNYVRGWSGTMGAYAIQIADAALRKSGVLPDPVLPAATLADIPVIRAFVVRHPSAQAQSIQDFNEHYKESKMVVDTITYLAKQGEPEAAMREARLDPVSLIKLDGIHEALGNSQRVVQLIYKNPSFTADEKRQLIDTTYMQMIEMAREGESMLRQIKKDLGPRFGKEAIKQTPTPELAAVY